MKLLIQIGICFMCLTPVFGQNLENLDEITKRKFMEFKGSLTIGANFYHTTADRGQQNPFSYIISGTPVLSIYGFDLPLSFTFASQQFSVAGPNTDMFDRYGMSPYYKWVTVHAGYRNVSFSPYTLNNHNFLGGGFELKPGKWRIGFVYGRFTDAIEEDTTASNPLGPSYKRKGYAAKLGYGDNKNHIEFSFLKAKDDVNSIEQPTFTDISPAENLSVGLSGKLTFLKNFSIETHLGVSAFTEDITARELSAYEDLPLLNLRQFYQPKASSRVDFAGDVSLNFQQSWYSVKAQYMRIDPEYETMGSYYFNNDIERYTIAPNFTFWKGKLTLGGSIGIQQDNLLKDKAATTRRVISSTNMQVNPFPQFSVNAQYSNYATEQSSGLVKLNDTIRVFQVNHSISITPSYFIAKEQFYHTFVLALSKQTLQDKNRFTENYTESVTNNANFNYQLRNNQFAYTLSGGLNYLKLNNVSQELNRYGFSAGAEKGLWEEKVKLGLNGMYNISRADGQGDGFILTNTLNISYIPSPAHAFIIRGQSILNRTSFEYNDYMLSVNYNFNF
ncbi:hypothetical protein ABWH96_10855 [Marivirga tractuosa]|uniref:hypothetical protein n=1 Tax=Marivirga tractuosa TaxID=1006 RepID=UPI0035CF46B7